MTNDAPQLGGQQDALTGMEPQINEAKLVYVVGESAFVPLFGDWLHSKTSSNPTWFKGGKNTPKSHVANVRRGLHPFGIPLTNIEGARCGNCQHHAVRRMGGTYHKCRLMNNTGGPGTDLRVSWHGCVKWEADE